ncbi:pilus biosynthesis protein [Yersinia pseudotuberculosis]|uniref:GspE/PulE family protein n=1 Tax=Yersinia pseudotuberculosis TaxID=633 RepID=UPI00061C043D|nr:ATPase, T2SS/T4P/T4SS family [Yersinia pseudotuberculosis]CNL25679.1 putative type IV pilus protein [Yersinia pseudotuberculosis]
MIIDKDIREFVFVDHLPCGQVVLVIDNNRRTDPRVQRWVVEMARIHTGAKNEFMPLSELNNRRARIADSSQYSICLKDLTNISERQKKVLHYFELSRELRASDIHLIIDSQLARVEMRLHGDLEEVDSLPRGEGMALASTIILSMCDVAETQFYPGREQGGRVKSDFARKVGVFGARYEHRPTADGLYVVMRIIDDDGDAVPTLNTLGFMPEQRTLVEKILRIPEGMVILSGPTGAGKSTTLRSFSRMYLDSTGGRRRLLTIEDPPEGRIKGAIQTPIIADKSRTDVVQKAWNSANASALRLDPDAILNGEMRDLISIVAAVYAAQTGHLLLTTLHANSAVGILKRMVVLGVSEALIADAQLIVGLISQRLVQTLCTYCRIPWKAKAPRLTPEIRMRLERYCCVEGVCRPEQLWFRSEEGCVHCQQRLSISDRIVSRGVTGRSVVAEVIRPDARFMLLYLTYGPAVARQYWVKSLRGITRVTHLLHQLAAGLVDPLDADLICPLDEDHLLTGEVPDV